MTLSRLTVVIAEMALKDEYIKGVENYNDYVAHMDREPLGHGARLRQLAGALNELAEARRS